eukprot:TRINITY_DN1775_c2_g1_i3.p1 TRINITY_DN1775_c2_g1~~TRINITY_DN1775_c2_g1_i3.p1  ORF type:complete len:951 (+),score=197.88 TRINITY_DN1775_c2_g1_i3:78-2930(+)
MSVAALNVSGCGGHCGDEAPMAPPAGLACGFGAVASASSSCHVGVAAAPSAQQLQPGVVPVRIRTASGKTAVLYSNGFAGGATGLSRGGVAGAATAVASGCAAAAPPCQDALANGMLSESIPHSAHMHAPSTLHLSGASANFVSGGASGSNAVPPDNVGQDVVTQSAGAAAAGQELLTQGEAATTVDVVGAADGAGPVGAEVLRVGDIVLRHGERASVVHVDQELWPPSYVVRMESTGQEVSCEGEHLAHVASASPAALLQSAFDTGGAQDATTHDAEAHMHEQQQQMQQHQQQQMHVQRLLEMQQLQQLQQLHQMQQAQLEQLQQAGGSLEMQQQLQARHAAELQQTLQQQQVILQHAQAQLHLPVQQAQLMEPLQQAHEVDTGMPTWDMYPSNPWLAAPAGLHCNEGHEHHVLPYGYGCSPDVPYAHSLGGGASGLGEGSASLKNHALEALAEALDRAEVEMLTGGRRQLARVDSPGPRIVSSGGLGNVCPPLPGSPTGATSSSTNYALQAAAKALGAADAAAASSSRRPLVLTCDDEDDLAFGGLGLRAPAARRDRYSGCDGEHHLGGSPSLGTDGAFPGAVQDAALSPAPLAPLHPDLSQLQAPFVALPDQDTLGCPPAFANAGSAIAGGVSASGVDADAFSGGQGGSAGSAIRGNFGAAMSSMSARSASPLGPLLADDSEDEELMAQREMEEELLARQEIEEDSPAPAAPRPRPPPLAARPPVARRPPSGGTSAAPSLAGSGSSRSIVGKPRPASSGRSTPPVPASCTSASKDACRGAPVRAVAQPPLPLRPKPRQEKRHATPLASKLEKRDFLVNSVLNDDLPSRSATPRMFPGIRSRSMPPDAVVFPPAASQRATACTADAASVAASCRDRGESSCTAAATPRGKSTAGGVPPVSLPSLHIHLGSGMGSARPSCNGHRAQKAPPASGSQSARNWRKKSTPLYT